MLRKFSTSPDSFLRSINLLYDCDEPERIAHFRPTTKGLAVLQALAGREADRAFLIIAPYGTGKSIAATYLLHVVENRPESSETLATIEGRLKAVDPAIGEYAERRRRAKQAGGMVLALSGYYKSLPEAIRDSALTTMKRLRLGRQARAIREHRAESVQDAVQILRLLEKKAAKAGRDQIVVMWDEFGQHIQTLITEGRPADLVEVQTLAEYVSRTDFPVTFGLLLHQDLIRYAGNLPHSVRSEWTKIEGRFRTIQYVDDSREIYELIADVVESAGDDDKAPKGLANLARKSRKLGLFAEFKQRDLEQLFRRAYPLEPTTLYLLPRLAARVAQNERTLFNFINSNGLAEPISPDCLFDYFSPSMQADTAVGGTYKQWLETKSALAKAEDQNAEKALKTTCLLALGLSGERTRTSIDLLRFAMRGFASPNGKDGVIAGLVDSKLLLHRRHSDEVAVWHGSDADLRARLDDRKSRRREEFDLVEFLSREMPPRNWKPVEYNSDFRLLRYFKGTYHTPESFETWVAALEMAGGLPPGADGEIAYVYSGTEEQLARTHALAKSLDKYERVLVAVPSEVLPLRELALEVQCLIEMQHDADLVDSDPLVLPELQQMADDAVKHLEHVLQRLQLPSSGGPDWFHCGQAFNLSSPAELRRKLSLVTRKVFPKTPIINSEAIVRHKPTPVMINARKKLLLGILERYGEENLGIEGNFPDSSMFRSVLLNTGLYAQGRGGNWRFVQPKDLRDPGLRAAWNEIRKFFSDPAPDPKRPADLFRRLKEPPLGVREGMFPILFAAGLKAFPSAISITRDGGYLPDILPSAVEDLCKDAQRYRVVVVELSAEQTQFLQAIIDNLGGQPSSEDDTGDLIRQCHDAFTAWHSRLPPAAMSTRKLSPGALKLRNLLRAAWDPVSLFLDAIPGLHADSSGSLEAVTHQLSLWTSELEASAGAYVEAGAGTIRRVLDLPESEAANSVVALANQWSSYFPASLSHDLGPGVESALVRTMGSEYSSEEEFVDVISSLIIHQPLVRWDDSTEVDFERRLGGAVTRVERCALAEAEGRNGGDSAIVAGLLEARLVRLRQRQESIGLRATDEACATSVAQISEVR